VTADPLFRGRLAIERIPEFEANARPALDGYDAMPLADQWPPRQGESADLSRWRACHACAERIPVRRDRLFGRDGRTTELDTWSYVCPACHATQRGSVLDGVDPQTTCHACSAELVRDGAPCTRCGMLRGWAVAHCPHCWRPQAVCMPHLAASCDAFGLECYGCKLVTVSLCIC
jgi:hypothetical protein